MSAAGRRAGMDNAGMDNAGMDNAGMDNGAAHALTVAHPQRELRPVDQRFDEVDDWCAVLLAGQRGVEDPGRLPIITLPYATRMPSAKD